MNYNALLWKGESSLSKTLICIFTKPGLSDHIKHGFCFFKKILLSPLILEVQEQGKINSLNELFNILAKEMKLGMLFF